MRGSQILLAADPQGRLEEGTIVGTPKPGIMVERIPLATEQGGRNSFRPCTLSPGTAGPVAILLEDELQGLSYDDAYVTGTRCRVYWPALGEEMNVRVGIPGTGTGASMFRVGDPVDIAGDATGNLSHGGADSPFQSEEDLADVSGETTALLFVRFITSKS